MPSGMPGDFSLGGSGLGSSGNVGTYTSDGTTNFVTIITGNTPINGQQVVFDPAGIPSGLSTGTTYYVINVNVNTFQVSLTPNGSVIDIGTGGGLLTLGSIRTVTIEGDVFIGGSHGYIEKVSSDAIHLTWLECRDIPVTGNLMKVWGVTVGPDGEPYSALEPMTGGPYDYVPHDVSYDYANDRLVVILARTDDTALIRIYDLDGVLVSEFAPIDVDTGWVNSTPLKIVVDCDGVIAYYTDMGDTIFRFDLVAEVQLAPFREQPVGSPYVFGDLDIFNSEEIVVNETGSGHGPLRAAALGNNDYVWADRINPSDGIYRAWKIRTLDHLDTLNYTVALTPSGLNDEITTLAAYYLRCETPVVTGLIVEVMLVG